VLVSQDPSSQRSASLADLAEEFDLPIQAIHAPTMLPTYRTWGTWIDKVQRSVALAEELEVPVVVVHPPFRWQRTYGTWLDMFVSSRTADDVTIAVENMCPFGGGFATNLHRAMTPEELQRFPNITLDTSHAAASRVNPLRFLDAFGDRVRHIHLSNNSGKGWDSHSAIDIGVLDMKAIIAGISRSGYSGGISLELDLRHAFKRSNTVHDYLVQNRLTFEALKQVSPKRAG
jgi:sugar phosphate isomerase/epimerase